MKTKFLFIAFVAILCAFVMDVQVVAQAGTVVQANTDGTDLVAAASSPGDEIPAQAAPLSEKKSGCADSTTTTSAVTASPLGAKSGGCCSAKETAASSDSPSEKKSGGCCSAKNAMVADNK
jgi:hypothetical protein